MWEVLIQKDQEWFVYLNNLGSPQWDPLWRAISDKWVALPLYALLLLLAVRELGWKRTALFLVFVALLITCTDQLANFFKYGMQRLRPCHEPSLEGIVRLAKSSCGGHFGYFSAHAANAFGLAAYFAVFWGVIIIGFSGLILWFPEFFTALGIPGWVINVATIVHSDEALLATGFIFTVHFFNTHFRPDKFPMDKVIFSGLVPLEEYKKDRPREYKKLVDSGELEKRLFKGQISEKRLRVIKIFGFSALFVGISLIGLIIYSVLFGYN